MDEDNLLPAPSDIWKEILKVQLDGVMMHLALFEQCGINNLKGYMCLHKHHGMEEFSKYLHVLGDFINEYQIVPTFENISQPIVEIIGKTKEEKMLYGLSLYQNWEKQVCEKLKTLQSQFEDDINKEYVSHLIADVHHELKCANLMSNDLLDGKVDDLEDWLIKKYGECD